MERSVLLRLKKKDAGAFARTLSTRWSRYSLDDETIHTLQADGNVEVAFVDTVEIVRPSRRLVCLIDRLTEDTTDGPDRRLVVIR